jgi:hypothetical protein
VLRFRHAEDCTADNCAFTASSGDGVRMDLHCQRIKVSNSLFAYLGGTGILLTILSTLPPAITAARTQPAEALRHD